MKERCISFMLFLAMVMTLVPAMAFAEPAVHSSAHTDWTEWNDSENLPTQPGYYLLATDVALSSTWVVTKGATHLCLDGHVIKASGSGINVITIGSESALSLYDCDGDVPHYFDVDPVSGLYTLNESSGTVVVSGGCITGGYSASCGGVYVYDGGVLNMYGGAIVGNAADECGGGVYFESGNVTLGGNTKIVNNIISDGGIASNLYIASGKAFSCSNDPFTYPGPGMSIGITTEDVPTIGSPVEFTTNGSNALIDFFFSDDRAYCVTTPEPDTCLILSCEYPIFVGDKHINKDNKDDVLGDGKVSYNPITQTLTLNNASITTYYTGHGIVGIFSKLPNTETLKIELMGSNVIGEGILSAPGMGINPLSGNLTISGNGDLTIYSLSSGIYSSSRNITFDEAFIGKLTIYNNGEWGAINDEGLGDRIASFNGGTFEFESPNSQCILADAIVVSGASLIIKGSPAAISTNTYPAIAAGLPVIASTNYDGSGPDETYSPDAINTYKYLKIGSDPEPPTPPAPDYSDYVAPKTKTFVDVKAGEYYYNAVKWAARKGITEGTDDTHFSPNDPITRAEAVTFLWRTAGSPRPTGNASKFTDVESGSYYEKAVAWAISKGITKGTTDTTFSPEDICSRAHIITFLARFAGVEDTDTESIFTDVESTAYYAAAVKWAKDNGITDGTSETTFSPDIDCTRAQAVTFLYRWKVK